MLLKIRETYPGAIEVDHDTSERREYVRFIHNGTMYIAERRNISEFINVYKLEGSALK